MPLTSSLAQKSNVATLSIERIYFLRDEEVVGSNPATPTEQKARSGLISPTRRWGLTRLRSPSWEKSGRRALPVTSPPPGVGQRAARPGPRRVTLELSPAGRP